MKPFCSIVLSLLSATALLAADDAGWEKLFDGTSTAKWRGYKQTGFPAKGWTVEGGALKRRRRRGSIALGACRSGQKNLKTRRWESSF